MRTGLGLPVGVDNVALLLSDNLKVPLPDLSSNGLTHRAQNSEVSKLASDVLVAGTLEQSEGSRGDVELGDVVALNDIPVSGEVREGGSTLEDDGRDTEHQRGVDDIGVASDPTDITTTEVSVALVDIEDVLAGHGSAKQVTGSGVQNTLGLASGTRGVEEEERVLRSHGLGREVVGPLLNLLVPPEVTAGGPGDLGTSALVDEDVLDVRALLKSIVDNLLGADQLATSLALVGGDDNLAAGIDNTVAERVGRETGKDDGVDSTDTDTGHEGDNGLGNHGQVDGNSVALADAHLLEDPGGAGNLAEELAVGDIATFAGVVGLVDDGNTVRISKGVAVDTVVRGVEATLVEPRDVGVREAAAAGGLEVAVP